MSHREFHETIRYTFHAHLTTHGIGRRIPRVHIPNGMGKFGHFTLHWSVGSRSSMVRLYPTNIRVIPEY